MRDLLRAAATGTPPPALRRPATKLPDDLTLVRAAAIPLADGTPSDDVLFDLLGDARLVLLGEASHGTHEFYRQPVPVSRRASSARKAFPRWPSRPTGPMHIGSTGTSADAAATRTDARRRSCLPSIPVVDVAQRGRPRFRRLAPRAQRRSRTRASAGRLLRFRSLQPPPLPARPSSAISTRRRPGGRRRARERYACFDTLRRRRRSSSPTLRRFGARRVLRTTMSSPQLVEMQPPRAGLLRTGRPARRGRVLLRGAERAASSRPPSSYYRAMFGGRVATWNVRDLHMADTLDVLLEDLSREPDPPAKIVVWAHNSHLGDARATENWAPRRAQRRAARPRTPRWRLPSRRILDLHRNGHGRDHWDMPGRPQARPPALPGSFEELFHEDRPAGVPALLLRRRSPVRPAARCGWSARSA